MPASSRRALAARLARLEAAVPRHQASAYEPEIIIANARADGETIPKAISRQFPGGLPPTPPGCIPHLRVIAVWAPGSRPDPPTLEHQPETNPHE